LYQVAQSDWLTTYGSGSGPQNPIRSLKLKRASFADETFQFSCEALSCSPLCRTEKMPPLTCQSSRERHYRRK